MSETKWTNEQWEAISEKDCSILVAAAAGAGKTAVLVERIIRKITDRQHPVDIDKLLIVTFTNAAAAEMRERIAEAISKVLEDNPDSPNIQRQLTLLHKASITTIHSFCLEVIRTNFHRINLDPDFRIANETEAALMKLESLQELFEELYEKETTDENFDELLECYGGNRDDQALQDMVLNLYNFIQSSPWPEKWLQDKTAELLKYAELLEYTDEDFSETPWGKILLESAEMELENLVEQLNRALEMIKDGTGGLQNYIPVLGEDLSHVEELLALSRSGSGHRWDRLLAKMQSVQFSRWPSAGKDADKTKQESVKNIRDEVKIRLRKIKERIFLTDSAGLSADLKSLYPLMKCLSGLVLDLGKKYADRKNGKSVLDFNDLEHFCLQVLTQTDEQGNIVPSPVALSYRERFSEILVDEYQDSNDVQEFMIGMLTGKDNPNIFMVGDVKQSIYRFRQARPELFLEKYNSYASERGGSDRKILLFKNFRSRPEILNAVNFLFKQIMSEKVGELHYTDAEALNPGAAFEESKTENAEVGGEVELYLLQTGGQAEAGLSDSPDQDEAEAGANGRSNPIDDSAGNEEGRQRDSENEEKEEVLENIQCEARLIARLIKQLREPDEKGKVFQVWDKIAERYRCVEFRDIVILLRTTRNWSEVFMEELTAQGIPAFADTGAGFFKTIEIQVMMSLLQIIDNPLQDIPLLAVLRSPVADFTTEDLAELRLADRKASLYKALQILAGSETPAAMKAAAFSQKLLQWRRVSQHLSTERLLWRLYQETGYYAAIGAMPLGEQRQANLRILFERARQFEETSYKGLFHFVNFIDKLKDSRNDLGSAKILGENDNVVRIMSIHKSKGLEFPVVILAGCGKKFNLQDMNKNILLHHDLGFGPEVVTPSLRLSYPSLLKQALREKLRAETLSEEMRILYVALTRAREKLVITATVKDLDKDVRKWAESAGSAGEKLPAYEVLHSNRYLDWIGPALMRHQACTLRPHIFSGRLIGDPSIWRINTGDIREMKIPPAGREESEQELEKWLDYLTGENQPEGVEPEIERRLSWVYPFAALAGTSAKLTVTELKRRFEQNSPEEGLAYLYPDMPVKRPMFMEEKKGLSAAEAGTVLHFIMQHLDYGKEDIEIQIEKMINKDLLTKQQAQGIDVNKIRTFLQSDLGRRMCASRSINREVPFNMEIPCGEVYEHMDSEVYQGENILLQGVIDCFFEEPDGLVLLDYKTDYVPEGGSGQLRERYRVQLAYYARALETLTGKRVKEKYVYLFAQGDTLAY
ncbi:ATP-dependent helicase/nuclease subunit A [Syntrophobotulus glycolicus DSM 8271]|uniref:ATP-dependent helicase/nuclease subunit A n=1 Tax=Syntrophobotulus glycolicus (strain DSM 8271 / FlGlyR) TaxID=645991 RepID=F0SZ81_SYNGF|nr:UvrD-helicase domain-containing protein [Syntrophobotulus glycolicus]ADY57199.1 ATP-dependent helicase/nuclease subunit A [Syntrophobotulus glycolicus DSM 8271]